MFHFFDDRELIRSMYIGECCSEFLLLFSKLPKWYTCREASLRFSREDIFCDRFDLLIGLRHRPFPLFTFKTRKFTIRSSDIFGDTSQLGHRNENPISSSIFDFHIFSFDETDTFLEYLDISTDSMFTMYDEIADLDLEKEVEMFDGTFSYSVLYEYRPEDII